MLKVVSQSSPEIPINIVSVFTYFIDCVHFGLYRANEIQTYALRLKMLTSAR